MRKEKLKFIIGKCFSALLIVSFIAIFFYFIYILYNPIKEMLLTGNDLPFEQELEKLGIWKYIVIILMNTFQVFLTIIPGEPTQFLAGIALGKYFGFVCCIIGIAIGNTILYTLVHFFDFNIKPKKAVNNDKINKLVNTKNDDDTKSLTWFILGLYFAPVIPYGLIAYTAAKKDMKFMRYIIVTTLGTIPSIIVCIATSTILLNTEILKLTNLVPALIFGFALLIIISLLIKFKKQINDHILNRSIRSTIILFIPLVALLVTISVLLFSKRYFSCAILLCIIFTYAILYFLFSSSFAKLFTKKKMKDFQASVVTKQNKLLYWFFAKILYLWGKIKFNLKVNKNGIKKLEKPSVVLFNHGSALDFVAAFTPLYPQNINIVTAYYYFCNYHLGRLLHALGCFPKFLYQPDISAIKNMKKVIKENGILGLAPEGRLSPHGEMESFIPSTVKFIKKEKINVYLFKINGNYFTKPKWASTYRKGRVDVTWNKIIDKDDIDKLSLQEIYDIINENLYYNEYDWIKKEKVKFKGKKFAEGLEYIFYHCPVCESEFSFFTHNNKITCSHCKTVITLNSDYSLSSDQEKVPNTITDFYNYQKKIERENIQDPNYKLESKVTLKNPDNKGLGFSVVGEGVCTLTHEGLRYVGTKNGENVDILFRLENLPALPFGVKEDFEVYHDQTLYYFVPENIETCVKFSVVEEQMYEDYIEKNNIDIINK